MQTTLPESHISSSRSSSIDGMSMTATFDARRGTLARRRQRLVHAAAAAHDERLVGTRPWTKAPLPNSN